MKRRVFLGSIVSVLIGFPLTVQFFGGNRRRSRESHLFSKELKKYRALVDGTPARLDQASAVLPKELAPLEKSWRYVIFMPSFLPPEFSQASGSDPDMFVVRDGKLFADRNMKGQNFIYGGDSKFNVLSATVSVDQPVEEISLLVRDNRIVPAQKKGVKHIHQRDWHFYHLLTLKDLPDNTVKPGMKWRSDHGRIKPFEGFTTHYEVAGFSEIAGRKTVDIAFSGKIPNLVGMSGLTSQKLNPGTSMTNEHHGHAWFDLETGLLVRQEIEMETVCSTGAPWKRRGDRQQNEGNPLSMAIKSNYVTQLFTV